MTETPSNRHDDIGTSPRCPTKVIENKPICLCFPCCMRDLSCLDLALLPHASRHVLDRHKFPGGRPPYKSNFYCHPGRAGGTPMLLGLGVRGGIYLSVLATGNRSINVSADGRRAGFSTVFSSCWPAITTTNT